MIPKLSSFCTLPNHSSNPSCIHGFAIDILRLRHGERKERARVCRHTKQCSRPGVIDLKESAMLVLRRQCHTTVDKAAFLKHRFKGWEEERKSKLTASTLKNALGFRKGSRVALWKEKTGLTGPFKGCPATWWNNLYEETALDKYKEITGNDVSFTGFHVYEKNRDDWLAASPDGLIEGQNGVLEIKCPFHRLAEETEDEKKKAFPWEAVPVKHMPQAQGLMEILDRDSLDFFVWTPCGSSLFRINRDPNYWALIFPHLRDFWLQHVLPAKALTPAEINSLCPSPQVPNFTDIWDKSKELVVNSRLLVKELHS